MSDNLTKEQRHKNMQHIKSKDTVIEIKLRHALWHKGYRYRINFSDLPGKPDIVLTKERIAIFCDSEFFHGKDWDNLKSRLEHGSNPDYWVTKIEKNRQRDKEVDRELRGLGWKVIRFWGKDIMKDINGCVKTVEEAVLDWRIEDGFLD